MNICIPGAAGYVGSALVPQLLEAGHRVTVYDSFLYQEPDEWLWNLQIRPERLTIVRGDVRDLERFRTTLPGIDAVLHLACLSNDPSCELDAAETKAVNYLSFQPLIHAVREAGIPRFIFASSSSVYGVSEAPEVCEDHPLAPLTDYSSYKALCEEIVREYQSPSFTTCIIRPATVCGPSSRMRFDLAVNILTNCAVHHQLITVFGGSQRRPSIHIEDLCDLYRQMLTEPAHRIAGQTFNAGRENHTLLELARIVQSVVEQEYETPVSLETTATNDLRSYHVCSRKIGQALGFYPHRSVADAVRGICRGFKAGRWPDSFSTKYCNVQALKKRG